ncbi:hypothetical protein [Pseudomonas sp.]|uniref:hypothetical protein n=1 Tax=Pseudomonas sp. TaxID=306 RepID=UPI00258A9A32|nr:hypothetical protein [Pseudomonas sp.]
MAKRSTDRIKFKIWHPTGSMEFDGTIAEGLYYGAHALPSQARLELIEKLKIKHAELDAVGR